MFRYIYGEMVGFQRNCFGQSFGKSADGLHGEGEHYIQIDIIEPGFAGMIEALINFRFFVDASQHGKFGIIK